MRNVLRQRNFFLVWLGGLVSLAGDWMLYISLPIYVYQLTGSELAMSGMLAVEILPALVLGSVAGVFVDRWDRRRTLILCNLLLAIALLPLAAVRSAGDLWIVYGVAVATSLLSQFHAPAQNALVPRLVGEDQLVTANSLNSAAGSAARLIGPPLGGALVVASGMAGITLVDAATFVFAAALLALVTVSAKAQPSPEAPAAGSAATALGSVWREWLQGLRLVREDPYVARLLFIAGLPMLGEGVLAVMLVVWIAQVLHGGAPELGWLMSAQAAGGLLGGLVVARAGERVPAVRLLGVSAIVFALLDAVLFVSPLWLPATPIALLPGLAASTALLVGMGLLVVVGLPVVGFMTALTSLLQSSVSDEYRGRLFGMLGTTWALLRLAGVLLAGALGGRLGPVVMLVGAQSGGYFVVGLLALALLPRAARTGARAPATTAGG